LWRCFVTALDLFFNNGYITKSGDKCFYQLAFLADKQKFLADI